MIFVDKHYWSSLSSKRFFDLTVKRIEKNNIYFRIQVVHDILSEQNEKQNKKAEGLVWMKACI